MQAFRLEFYDSTTESPFKPRVAYFATLEQAFHFMVDQPEDFTCHAIQAGRIQFETTGATGQLFWVADSDSATCAAPLS